jgi:hypothetical protein
MDKIADPNVEQLTEDVKKIEIDSSRLTALSQEVISRQATVSIRSFCGTGKQVEGKGPLSHAWLSKLGQPLR